MVLFGKRALRRTELALLLVGVLCVGYCIVVIFEAIGATRASAKITSQIQTDYTQSTRTSFNTNEDATNKTATVMGRLEVPEISLSVPILSNYESESLLKGIGHIPGTALPGGLGTLGLAGHRDTYFRPLRNIRKDMTIKVVSHDGTYRYAVDSTEIVKPENVSVLDIGSRPALTLVTCYPFYYVGSAPLRFIVHAHLMSASPDTIQQANVSTSRSNGGPGGI